MDENLTRGYCQLRSGDAPTRVEIVSSPPATGRGRYAPQTHVMPPLDNYRFVYISMMLCGAGFLLPYNTFIAAADYYMMKFLGSTIIFDVSLTYICSAFVGVLLNNVLIEKFSLRVRVTVGFTLSFVMLMFIAGADIGLTLFDRVTSYRVTLVAVVIAALGCTVQQSSFYGFTSMLPPRYTQAVMTGESAAGLIVSINRIATKFGVHYISTSTLLFFFISTMFILISCFAFYIAKDTEFVQFYVNVCKTSATVRVDDDQQAIMRPLSTGATTSRTSAEESPSTPPPMTSDTHQATERSAMSLTSHPARSRPAEDGSVPVSGSSDEKWIGRSYRKHISMWDSIKGGLKSRYQVARCIWPYMMSIAVVYFVTLSLFPGIEAEITGGQLGSWMPIVLMAIFNLFDFIGKIIASIPYDWPRGKLALCSLARIALVPLMMFCAAPRQSPLLSGVHWPLFFSALLGVTNGYFGSVPMILAPGRVPDLHKELTGNIMTISYSVGLTTGSAVAYLLNAALGPRHGPDWQDEFITSRNGSSDAELLWRNLTRTNPYLPPSEFFPG